MSPGSTPLLLPACPGLAMAHGRLPWWGGLGPPMHTPSQAQLPTEVQDSGWTRTHGLPGSWECGPRKPCGKLWQRSPLLHMFSVGLLSTAILSFHLPGICGLGIDTTQALLRSSDWAPSGLQAPLSTGTRHHLGVSSSLCCMESPGSWIPSPSSFLLYSLFSGLHLPAASQERKSMCEVTLSVWTSGRVFILFSLLLTGCVGPELQREAVPLWDGGQRATGFLPQCCCQRQSL